MVNRALDRVRQYLARDLGLVPEGAHALAWVTDWPLFEWNEGEGRLEALHHPFTAPNQEDLQVRCAAARPHARRGAVPRGRAPLRPRPRIATSAAAFL